ncbi:hypothetical protein V6N13_023964 [Hibiscus sabdariffa]
MGLLSPMFPSSLSMGLLSPRAMVQAWNLLREKVDRSVLKGWFQEWVGGDLSWFWFTTPSLLYLVALSTVLSGGCVMLNFGVSFPQLFSGEEIAAFKGLLMSLSFRPHLYGPWSQ